MLNIFASGKPRYDHPEITATYKPTAVQRAREFAHQLNVIRCIDYHVSKEWYVHPQGRRFFEADIQTFGPFSRHDQDRYRSDLKRKHDFAAVFPRTVQGLGYHVLWCHAQRTSNPYALHKLRIISDAAGGSRTSAEVVDYLNRSTPKLEPHNIRDLDGWDPPGTDYFDSAPPNFRYEHAKWGAVSLRALYMALHIAHLNPHLQRALQQDAAVLGGQLTLRQLGSDCMTVGAHLGALLFLLPARRKLIAYALAAACALAAASYSLSAAIAYSKRKGQQSSCRNLVHREGE